MTMNELKKKLKYSSYGPEKTHVFTKKIDEVHILGPYCCLISNKTSITTIWQKRNN
jgi:hypothetical protein